MRARRENDARNNNHNSITLFSFFQKVKIVRVCGMMYTPADGSRGSGVDWSIVHVLCKTKCYVSLCCVCVRARSVNVPTVSAVGARHETRMVFYSTL